VSTIKEEKKRARKRVAKRDDELLLLSLFSFLFRRNVYFSNKIMIRLPFNFQYYIDIHT
jgi:hypothetical protein